MTLVVFIFSYSLFLGFLLNKSFNFVSLIVILEGFISRIYTHTSQTYEGDLCASSEAILVERLLCVRL